MKSAVYGAGAIGGLLAAALADKRSDVVLVCRTRAQAEAIRRDGLEIRSPQGNRIVQLDVAHGVAAEVDVAYVTVKAYALASILDTGALRSAETVVPLLNGLEHPTMLRSRLAARVRVGTIYAEAERITPTRIEHRSVGDGIELAREPADVDAIAATLSAAGFAVRTRDEREVLWQKFTRVCWAATLCGVTDAAVGEARRVRPDDAERLAAEIAAIATADGAPIDADALRASLWAIPATMRPSMTRDIAAGGASELDAITGALVRCARAYGLPIPVAERLYGYLAGIASQPTGAVPTTPIVQSADASHAAQP